MTDRTRRRRAVRLIVSPTDAEQGPVTVTVTGRVLWALGRLVEAGPRGCTPATEPAPRWSAYVHTLRSLGVPVETVTEPHGGPYPGSHARYVLHATVTPATEGGASDGKAV